MYFYQKSSVDKTSASRLLTVQHYSAEVNVIFAVGRWNYNRTHYFMYICESVTYRSAPYQKGSVPI